MTGLNMRIVSKTILYDTEEEFCEHYKDMIRQGYDYAYKFVSAQGIEVTWKMVYNTKWNSYSISAVPFK